MKKYIEPYIDVKSCVTLESGKTLYLEGINVNSPTIQVLNAIRLDHPEHLEEAVYMAANYDLIVDGGIEKLNPDLVYMIECVPVDKKIHRIKLCRALTSLGLKESKDIIDTLDRRYDAFGVGPNV